MWVNDTIRSVKYDNLDRFRDHANYPAWLAALEELGRAHGWHSKPTTGATASYCKMLVDYGADPDQIRATFALLFL